MADTTVPTPSPIWDIVAKLTPSLGQCLVLIVGCAVGVGGTLANQRLLAPKSLPVALPDRPTPVACAQDFHDLTTAASGVNTKLDEILARLGKKAGR